MEKFRKDFNILQDSNTIFFDNGAGSLKPKQVIDAVCEYYMNDNGNPHSADYPLGRKTVNRISDIRNDVAKFIGAESSEQIVFTSGSTFGLNMVIKGLEHHLKDGDKVAMTLMEHASMILPMFSLNKELVYFDPFELDVNLFKDVKIIGIISSSNVTGQHVDIKNVIKEIRKVNKDAFIVIDGAQHVPHKAIDVTDIDCDFLVASSHKMLGPTGSGFIYAKDLSVLEPLLVGGGMNIKIHKEGTYTKKQGPHLFEGGTQNAAGIYGLGAAIKYLENVGMDNIEKRESELRKYLIEKLSTVEGITVYAESDEGSSTVSFNIEGNHPHDIVYYLGERGICLRAGNHCAKLIKCILGPDYSVRASLCFYNTKEEIDKMVDELNKAGGDFLGDII